MISILFNICKAAEDSRTLHRLKMAGIRCPKASPKPRFRRFRIAGKTPEQEQ